MAPAVSAAASEALSAARGAFQGCAAGRGSGQSPHWTHCPFCAACEPDAGSSLPFLSSLVPRLSPACPPLSGVLTAGLSVWLVLPVDLWFLEEWAGVHSRLVTSPWPPQVTLPSLDQECFMGSFFSQHHEDIPPCLLGLCCCRWKSAFQPVPCLHRLSSLL